MQRMKGNTKCVYSVYESYGIIVFSSNDTTVKKWNPCTGECVSTLEGHSDFVQLVDANNSIICFGSRNGTVRVWDSTATATKAATTSQHGGRCFQGS